MSDLRERFDYSAVLESVTTPGLDELRARAGKRRTRRAVGVSATLSLAAVAVLAAVTLPTLLPISPATPPADGGRAWPVPPGEIRLTHVEFVDARHGFAYYESRPTTGSCEGALRATDDGGESWSDLRGMPCVPPGERIRRVSTLAVDADTLLQANQPGTQGHLSHDGGRTWRAYGLRTRVAEAFPPTVTPHGACASPPCTKLHRLGWYDRETGDLMLLANGPELVTMSAPVRATDGSVWVTGTTSDGRYVVAVTRDNGRSWTTPPLGLTGKAGDVARVATYDGTVGYLVIIGRASDNGAILRTGDGGKSWSRVSTIEPRFGLYGAYVATGGELLISGDDTGDLRWHISHDDGASFARAEMPQLDRVTMVAGRYTATTAFGPMPPYTSVDGLTWSEVKPPTDR
ncbi:MAG: hypothetical protein ACRDT6_25745 [Micromonosporaceae bacterium]